MHVFLHWNVNIYEIHAIQIRMTRQRNSEEKMIKNYEKITNNKYGSAVSILIHIKRFAVFVTTKIIGFCMKLYMRNLRNASTYTH